MKFFEDSHGRGFLITHVGAHLAEVAGQPVTAPFRQPVSRERFVEVAESEALLEQGWMLTWKKEEDRYVLYDFIDVEKGGGCSVVHFHDRLRIDVVADLYESLALPLLTAIDDLLDEAA